MTMVRWSFEPGHTVAHFRVRHMMVTWVEGHFPGIEGTIEQDLDDPANSSVEVWVDTANLWTGDADRDAHLHSADFFDVENHPRIHFASTQIRQLSADLYSVVGQLTIRGVTRAVEFELTYLGQWQTSYWVGGEDKGPITRAGFMAQTTINRHDFGVSWNDQLDRGGVVVGDRAYITVDFEALRDTGMAR